MKILIVGGGPSGLYAGLLLKKRDPQHEVTIIERNPKGATYGWGVVFSSLTLTAFREADYTTYKDITDQFVIWDPIDVIYRGALIRCGGHTFAGMSRRKLLEILAARCVELGVIIHYEQEFEDFASFKTYDVVIAGDGVNSKIRAQYADIFKPSLRVGKAKYIWFGTHRVFDSFTFVIRPHEHGLFQVHAYPFDGDTSTFIVECDEETWRSAGLDKADEAASIAFCEALFADVLQGHRLMSNKSLWVNFIEVKNRKWSHENIVLLGDAVHTAHFSIGSGTKLAMEDAISLVNAFELHGENIPAVFKAYEMERRPRVEITQKAALESQNYFETLKHYIHLEPVQFAFHLLTRSGRLNYDNLRLRDPYFIERVDRWFGAQNGLTALVSPPPLFAPFQLKSVKLVNRVVFAAPVTYTAVDGLIDPDYAVCMLKLAQEGAGLVLTEPAAVSADGRITPGCAGLYTPEHQRAWAKLVSDVRQQSSAKIALQLSHAGPRGAAEPRHFGMDIPLKKGGWPLLSASPLPYTTRSPVPTAMTREDMNTVREQFVSAAKMADAAGFDMLLLNCAHGYLLASFLSPLTNQRDDEFGGVLENRAHFPFEVVKAVRAVWPQEKPLAVAINASDWVEGGIELSEVVWLATQLKTHGCDMIFPLAGQTLPKSEPDYSPNFLSPYAEAIRNGAHIPTLTGGGIVIANQANSILAAGSVDLCIIHPNQV